MDNLKNLTTPVALLIRGLPGSGKTYLAGEIKKAIGAEKVVMLDPDATDYQSQEYQDHVKTLTTENVDASLHAYRFLRGKAYAGIAEHKIIIWNQPFTNLEIFNKMAGRLRDQAAEHDTSLPILVVEIEIDSVMAKQRVDKRKNAGGHGPSDDTFERFARDYKSFASDGYCTVTTNGAGDISQSVQTVLAALEKLLRQS